MSDSSSGFKLVQVHSGPGWEVEMLKEDLGRLGIVALARSATVLGRVYGGAAGGIGFEELLVATRDMDRARAAIAELLSASSTEPQDAQ